MCAVQESETITMPLTVYYLNSEHSTEIFSLIEFLTILNSLHLFPNDETLIGISAESFQQTLLSNNVAFDAIVSRRLLPSNNQQRWLELQVHSVIKRLLEFS